MKGLTCLLVAIGILALQVKYNIANLGDFLMGSLAGISGFAGFHFLAAAAYRQAEPEYPIDEYEV